MAIRTDADNNDYRLEFILRNPRLKDLVPAYADEVETEEGFVKISGYDVNQRQFEIFLNEVEVLGFTMIDTR